MPDILLVEDKESLRRVLRLTLERAGYSVTEAADAREAINEIGQVPHKIVLTDLRMPVMDGIELLQHVAKLPDHQKPSRIIAISGEYDAGVLEGHPVQFVAKPFDVDTLLEMLGGKPN